MGRRAATRWLNPLQVGWQPPRHVSKGQQLAQNQPRFQNPGEGGTVTGWTTGFGGRPTGPEYRFERLYESALETLRHYVGALKRLEAMPRFGAEAS